MQNDDGKPFSIRNAVYKTSKPCKEIETSKRQNYDVHTVYSLLLNYMCNITVQYLFVNRHIKNKHKIKYSLDCYCKYRYNSNW